MWKAGQSCTQTTGFQQGLVFIFAPRTFYLFHFFIGLMYILLLVNQKQPQGSLHRVLPIRSTNSTQLIKATDWPDIIRSMLIPSGSVSPCIYGLPKIHKTGNLLCPIVNMRDSPTYEIAKYLTTLMKPHQGLTDASVKNSSGMVALLDTISLTLEVSLV